MPPTDYLPGDGVPGCYKEKGEVCSTAFVMKLSLPCAVLLTVVGIVALANNSMNGAAYLMVGLWGFLQSYQLNKMLKTAPADGVWKHPVLNVCKPCDGKIPTAQPANGQQQADVPYAAPAPTSSPAKDGNPFGAPTGGTDVTVI